MAGMRTIVCPLDWGLGHATRCVPLIRELLRQGSEVEIGCCDSQKAFFSLEFPELVLHEAPSYQIRYPTQGWQMPFWLLCEFPRLRHLIRTEQLWLEELCKKRSITHVISDNRFGCFSKRLPSVYMTHQLRIAFPDPLTFCEKAGVRWHASWQKHYRETWIPDYAEAPGLAGKLSHTDTSLPLRYLGPLSRFTPTPEPVSPSSSMLDILALISGPEPQRTLFEKKILTLLAQIEGKHALVRGLPGSVSKLEGPEHVIIANHLNTPELQKMIANSRTILCRPGYSTLMDLALFGSHTLLIPTPGQTEQEYLAKNLAAAQQANCITQNKLNRESILHACNNNIRLPIQSKSKNLIEEAIAHLLKLV